jgi:hypothetical protein
MELHLIILLMLQSIQCLLTMETSHLKQETIIIQIVVAVHLPQRSIQIILKGDLVNLTKHKGEEAIPLKILILNTHRNANPNTYRIPELPITPHNSIILNSLKFQIHNAIIKILPYRNGPNLNTLPLTNRKDVNPVTV